MLRTMAPGHAAASLDEATSVIGVVDAIFDLTDAKEWAALQRLFESDVTLDFTSLTGGEPVSMPAAQLIRSWQDSLHPKKQTFHLAAHHHVELDGDTATVGCKGYAYNVLDADLGGGMWEVWGAYRIPLHRHTSGWRATGLTFHAWHTRGDENVRTHALPGFS
jgi:hypothetical protein